MEPTLCYHCFQKKPENAATCPHCGYDAAADAGKHPLALPCGTVLGGKFIIGHVLGQGGFGITYISQDYQTKERVAVKEFFPDAMAMRTQSNMVSAHSGVQNENFQYGKACFLNEAETLAEFIGNPHIIRVYSYFEENGTAYYVMEYIEGESLQQYAKEHTGRLSWAEVQQLLYPIMEALGAVHEKGIIHRDVTPDNIYITKDGNVKLIDFGAARYSLGEKSRSLDVIIKHGFAPMEQYTRRGRQGPYTDVYALAATMYYMLSGRLPQDSIDRLEEDNLADLSSLGVSIPEGVEDVIMKAMALRHGDRYQTMHEFYQALQAQSNTPIPAQVQHVQPKVTNVHDFTQVSVSQPVEQPDNIQQTRNVPNIENLLKRGFLAMEYKKWSDADSCFEQVLNENVGEYRAYIGKLCVEYRIESEEKLATLRSDFTGSENYQLACRFGGADVEKRLYGYYQQNLYDAAMRAFEGARTPTEFQNVRRRFTALDGFKDSALYAEKCSQKAKQIQDQREYEKKKSVYDDIIHAMQTARTPEDFQNVRNRFIDLGGFEDSAQKADECTQMALQVRGKEEYDKKKRAYDDIVREMQAAKTPADYMKVRDRFVALGDFGDSARKADLCLQREKEAQERDAYDRKLESYKSAQSLMMKATQPDLEEAANRFNALSGFEDADKMRDQCLAKIQELKDYEEQKKQRKQNTIAKMKRGAVIGAATILMVAQQVGIECLGLFVIVPNVKKGLEYNKAVQLFENGNYAEAEQVFSELGDYKDSESMVIVAQNTFKDEKYTSAIQLYENGDYAEAERIFSELESYKDSANKMTEAKYAYAIKLYENGNNMEAIQLFYELGNYKESLQMIRKLIPTGSIATYKSHTVGLKSDGTVVAVGDNTFGQCNVSEWKDIVAVAAGSCFTVGLKSDGTVVAVGYNYDGQLNVSAWTDVVAIAAGDFFIVGLKSDGTVAVAGSVIYGEDVEDWKDIVAISAGEYHIVGLTAYGKAVTVGSNEYGKLNLGKSNLVAVSAGKDHSIEIKSDNTVVAVGDNKYHQRDVDNWKDIVAVSAGGSHTVGLKSDGTVVAVGNNSHEQCDVSTWKNIVAVSAGNRYTVGLKSDGTVVATGENSKGQCNVSDWKDIKTTK